MILVHTYQKQNTMKSGRTQEYRGPGLKEGEKEDTRREEVKKKQQLSNSATRGGEQFGTGKNTLAT